MGSKTTSVRVYGTELRCAICKHDEFERKHWYLISWFAALTHWIGKGPAATCYVCTRCGYVHWFVPVSELDAKAG